MSKIIHLTGLDIKPDFRSKEIKNIINLLTGRLGGPPTDKKVIYDKETEELDFLFKYDITAAKWKEGWEPLSHNLTYMTKRDDFYVLIYDTKKNTRTGYWWDEEDCRDSKGRAKWLTVDISSDEWKETRDKYYF